MPTPLTVNRDRGSDGRPRLIATGEIDLSNVDTFTEALDATISDSTGEGHPVTVDLSAVEYLDSAAINVLSTHADDVGNMRVVAHPYLMPVLTISGLTELADVQAAPGA
jgi:anti-anti-sigma factor